MIATLGTQPIYRLAPHDYRYALDAACAYLAGATQSVEIWNNLPALNSEIEERFGDGSGATAGADGLWIEPLAGDWQTRLAASAETKQLVIISSGLLAARLPERQGWPFPPTFKQFRQFRLALKANRFRVTQVYGIHTPGSIILNQLGQQLARFSRAALADRVQFAARRIYCSQGGAAFATVRLIMVERGGR